MSNSEEYRIENNIPTPRRRGKIKGIMQNMNNGDSVSVESKQVPAWYNAAKRMNIEITTQKIKGTNTTRIWVK